MPNIMIIRKENEDGYTWFTLECNGEKINMYDTSADAGRAMVELTIQMKDECETQRG